MSSAPPLVAPVDQTPADPVAAEQQRAQAEERRLAKERRWIGTGLVVSFVLLLSNLFSVLTAGAETGRWTILLSEDEQITLAVLLAGALGGCIHVASSFADYVGNRKFTSSWNWWYYLRPLVGASLALLFLCAVRGGVLPGSGTNAWGMALLGGVVGLFSKQATDKLDDLFDVLLSSGKDAQRRDGLGGAPAKGTPAITGVAPARVAVGSGAQMVTVSGRDFPTDAVVRFNGQDRKTEVVSVAELRVSLLAEDTAAAGTFPVTVASAGTPGTVSPAATFEVFQPVEAGGGGGLPVNEILGPDARLVTPGGEVVDAGGAELEAVLGADGRPESDESGGDSPGGDGGLPGGNGAGDGNAPGEEPR